MLKSRVSQIIGTIPAESEIYADPANVPAGTPATATDILIDRRAHAILDPAFPWKYAQAFVQLRQPLPAIINEPFIKQAFAHITGQVVSEDILGVQIFQHPKWQTKRAFLEALLLLPDLRLDEVAKHVGLPVSVVMLYEQLFWSVRDRRDDVMFINELCYPESRLVELRGDGEYFNEASPRDLMLRAAYRGDLETVLQIFGSRTPQTEQLPNVSMKRVKARILADADFVVRAGGGANSRVPVMNAALRIISADKNTQSNQPLGDDVIGLSALSLGPGESILATLQGLMDTSQYERAVQLKEADNPQPN